MKIKVSLQFPDYCHEIELDGVESLEASRELNIDRMERVIDANGDNILVISFWNKFLLLDKYFDIVNEIHFNKTFANGMDIVSHPYRFLNVYGVGLLTIQQTTEAWAKYIENKERLKINKFLAEAEELGYNVEKELKDTIK